MTTPAVFTERWANPPAATCTGPGGQGAPAAGTPQTWTMGGGFAAFTGMANPATVPPTIFRIFDRAQPGEIIQVTDSRTNPWQVIRGDQGTPVVHAAGFEVLNVLSAHGIRSLAPGVPSGNGLVIPHGTRRTVETFTTLGLRLVASIPVPAGEAVAGTNYEAFAYGYIHFTGNPPGLVVRVEARWVTAALTATLGDMNCNVQGGSSANSPPRWRATAILSPVSNPGWTAPATINAVASTMLQMARNNNVANPVDPFLGSQPNNSGNGIDNSRDATFELWVGPTAGALGTAPGQGYVIQGGRAWRAA